MDISAHSTTTAVSIDEIRRRVAFALDRNHLCRGIEFDIVRVPRLSAGANWTITIQQVAPDALWEASEIVSDIQQAYVLTEAQVFHRAA